MRTLPALCLSVLFLTSCSRQASQKPPDPLTYFLNRFPMQGTLFSPDGNRVLFENEVSGSSAVFVYDIGSKKATPLVTSPSGARPLSYFKEDYRVLYSARPEGQVVEHLFVRDPDGTVVDVTPWPGAQSVFYKWSPDGKSFYFGTNKQDRKYLYLFRMLLADWTSFTVLQTQDIKFASLSPDSRYLALWRYLSPTSSMVYTYDLQAKVLQQIAPREGTAIAMPQCFDREKPGLYYLTNEGHNRTQLVEYHPAKGDHSKLSNPESLVFARHSPTGRYRVLGFYQADKLWVKLIDTSDGQSKEVFRKQGIILDFARNERVLLFSEEVEPRPEVLQIFNLASGETLKIMPN